MDETTIATEQATQEQQLPKSKANGEGLHANAIPDEKGDSLTDSTTPMDLEKTPEFEAWKRGKIQEAFDYLKGNWKMDIAIEKLVMKEMYFFPDPDNARGYASIHSGCNYINPTNGEIAINPATGRQMSYAIWRKIDPPTPESPEPTI